MALNNATLVFTRAAVAASGTSVAPAIVTPDNCVEIVMLNRIASVVTFSLGAPGGALPDNGTNGVIPSEGSLTVSCGNLKNRAGGADMELLRFDCPAATGNIDIIYRCVSANAMYG